MKRSIQNMKKWGLLMFVFASMCGIPMVGHAQTDAAKKVEIDSIRTEDYMNLKFTGEEHKPHVNSCKGGKILERDGKDVLLTNRKYLRVSGNKELEIRFEPNFCFIEDNNRHLSSCCITDNKNQFMDNRPAGYIEINEGTTIKIRKIIDSNTGPITHTYIVKRIEPWTWSNIKLRIFTKDETHKKRQIVDTNLKDDMPVIKPNEPLVSGQEVNLEITRNDYAYIDKVKINDNEIKNFSYNIGGSNTKFDNKNVKQATLRVENYPIHNVADENKLSLSFNVKYLDIDGTEKDEEKTLFIKVLPKAAAMGANSIILWGVIAFILVIVLGVGVFFFICKDKGKSPQRPESSFEKDNSSNRTDASDKPISKENKVQTEKIDVSGKSGIHEQLETVQNSVPVDGENHAKYMPAQATSETISPSDHEEVDKVNEKVRFEKISDEKIVELVLKYMSKIYPKVCDWDEETFTKKLNNGWVRQFSMELNKYPELGRIEENQQTPNAIFQLIKDGFIGSDAKHFLDEKLKNNYLGISAYTTLLINYFAIKESEIEQNVVMTITPHITKISCKSVEECKHELDVLWSQLDKVRRMLADKNFKISDRQVGSLTELVGVIAQAVDGGECEELRNNELGELKEKVKQLTDDLNKKTQELDELKQNQNLETESLREVHDTTMAISSEKSQKEEEINELLSQNQMSSASNKQYEADLKQKQDECEALLKEKEEEINKLILSHDQILSAVNDKYEADLKQKQDECEARLKEKEEEINKLNLSHDQILSAANDKYKADLKQKQDECEVRLKEKEEEINKLNLSHEQNLSAANDKYKADLKQKQDECETRLKEKEEECARKLEKQQSNFEISMESQNETHQQELSNKQIEITQLNGQINELSVACHSDCARYIGEVQERIDSVDRLIWKLMEDTSQVSGEDSKFTNSIRKIQTGFEAFKEQVVQSAESWNSPAVRTEQVRADLQEYIMKGLKYGWVTIANYLNLYAGTTQELNTLLNQNGLNTAILSNLNAEILRLIGLFGVKVVVPHLLTDDYDSDYFTFENADRWITSFDSQMTPSNYESKVFDMSCVGYQIDGGKYYKPMVFYC